jgi:uncharacterized protein
MSGRLPREIDPIRLADEGVRLHGELPGVAMTRLRELAAAGWAPPAVMLDLQFERTAQGTRLLHGSIRTTVGVTCQRCLGPMSIEVSARPYFVLLGPGEASVGVSEDTETLVVEGPLSLSELAEDELLLAMPMIPVHDDEACAAPGVAPQPPRAEPGKPNPFAALRGQKGKAR